MKYNILITGVSGLLGNNLAFYLRNNNKVEGIYHFHPVAIPGVKTFNIDLIDYLETRRLISRLNPNLVIHCASRTDVDKMEVEKEDAWQSNVLTTRVLLDALRDIDAKFVYISTDSVYSGEGGPFKETGPVMPCNWYGKTKLESERLVLCRENSLILRTNLYGWNIQNKESLSEWFLKRLQKNQKTVGFSDALFSSIYSFLLAEILYKCVEKNLKGVYNCGCRDSCTKSEFGKMIAECFGYNPALIMPVSMDDAGLKAKRGKDLSLCVDSLEKDLGENLPTMIDSLKRFFSDWEKGIPEQIKHSLSEKPIGMFYPVREDIHYGGQAIDQTDINAVVHVLKSQYLTQGSEVANFEEEVFEYVGAKFAIAVNSGTAALHLACLACDIKPGDEGITSPITFIASANSMAYCGANIRFADIDPHTYNISPSELEYRITKNTKVVIPVHFAGQSCDMEEIRSIVSKKEKLFGHKIYIIEDASHALGSFYKGKKVGCCDYSDASVFSFHPVKHITTGEGGMVVTNDKELAVKIRNLRTHGMIKDPEVMSQNPGPWYYEQQELGYNYRITDFQSALGRSQLKKMTWFAARRRMIVESYNRAFDGVPFVTTPFEDSKCHSNFHLYVLLIDFESMKKNRANYMSELKDRGIQTQVHYIPIHLQPFYQKKYQTKKGDFPISEAYYDRCLSIPLYPGMADFDFEKVIYEIKERMKR
ncbi:MAG: UDP-4-amino-4,6-dideoxy-N-acetyl-beta-L-altrosamine transaminase [Desulfobacterales bacterium]|nr:UDP-4-amino-4,6-dideoxy-N-acetyl-beta-L-altrosamine transaminase [Desulfobacterales bacterium]